MERIDRAAYGLHEMDDYAVLKSPYHSLHPLAKLIVTILYIILTVSFDKYDFSGLVVMVLFPLFAFFVSGISIGTCFCKLKTVLPFVFAVGLFNPFLDRAPLINIGNIVISGGVISMITLVLKGMYCLMASFILVATTSMDAICASLRKIHVPNMIVTLLLLTYRYIYVMLDEVSVMTTAYKLRAPMQKGIRFPAWGSFLGQLLLRSMDRAEELYQSMQLRGFHGEFEYADVYKASPKDCIFTVFTIIALLICRLINIAVVLGSIALGGFF